eukprot:bmy_18401T0
MTGGRERGRLALLKTKSRLGTYLVRRGRSDNSRARTSCSCAVTFPSPPPRNCRTICHGGRDVRFVRPPPFGAGGEARAPGCPCSLGIQLLQGCDRPVCCGGKAAAGTDFTLAGGPRSRGRKPL